MELGQPAMPGGEVQALGFSEPWEEGVPRARLSEALRSPR